MTFYWLMITQKAERGHILIIKDASIYTDITIKGDIVDCGMPTAIITAGHIFLFLYAIHN
ncbi:MAG: hypothetical protein NT124_01915 [Candidatus Dependentiae bacterium]|nr:hypothetical protein [Candidatus Dependentiae bacterium]